MKKPTSAPARQQADVPWRDLLNEVFLLSMGLSAMALSLLLDIYRGRHDLFAPSGAIAALTSAIVAYMSLNKHYKKFLNYCELSEVPTTSANQRTVDRVTLVLSIIGTLAWAYGDRVFELLPK